MTCPGRRSARHLVDEIRAEGPRFRFFQAVRLLALSAETAKSGESKAPIPPSLRFASPLSLAFQASEIGGVVRRTAPSVEAGEAADRPAAETGEDQASVVPTEVPLEMSVGFMGMTGPSGVLPIPYTELFIDRRNQYRDSTGHRFLDLFTHRAVSLFYQAWRKHRFYLPYEAGHPDGFSRNLLDIVGVGLRHLQERLHATGGGIPDRFLIHYAGILSQRPIPAVNIAALVCGYFAVPAQVTSFVGQWMVLPQSEQSALDGRPCVLGQTTFVGERVWDRQSKLGLRLGPLDRAQFAQFLPGQSGLVALRELVQFCVGLTLDCEVTLVLKREAIPAPVLSADPSSGPRLGYSVWTHSHPPRHDAEEVRFTLLGNARLKGGAV